MKLLKRLLLVVVLISLVVVGVQLYWTQTAKSAAERALADERWPDARRSLRRYMWLYPRDAQAHLLMAEAYVSDNDVLPEEAVGEAIKHLQQVDDDSDSAAEARLREAQLWFRVRHRPAQAERIVRRAIHLDNELKEAHRLLWQILDMTNRSDYAEPSFWRVYELSGDDERPVVLRQWYLSQFAPGTANEPLDRAMGFLPPGQTPDYATEYRRLVQFRRVEADSPTMHASLASWYRREADPKTALQILSDAARLGDAIDDRFFIATLAATYVDLGEFELADQYLQRWPEPRDGYDYWNLTGIVQQEYQRDNSAAVESYREALEVWPGPIVWRTRFRLAQCLARTGDDVKAEEERRRAAAIQELLDVETHRRIRKALASLDDPHALQEVAQFYAALDRPREAECWTAAAKRAAGVP